MGKCHRQRKYSIFIFHICSGGIGGLGGLGGLGGGGGLGGICGVPIGFGVTTTVGGFEDDVYPGGYGSALGYGAVPPRGVAGVSGAFNRALHRGPYRRY
jgi:hypothetical protein